MCYFVSLQRQFRHYQVSKSNYLPLHRPVPLLGNRPNIQPIDPQWLPARLDPKVTEVRCSVERSTKHQETLVKLLSAQGRVELVDT